MKLWTRQDLESLPPRDLDAAALVVVAGWWWAVPENFRHACLIPPPGGPWEPAPDDPGLWAPWEGAWPTFEQRTTRWDRHCCRTLLNGDWVVGMPRPSESLDVCAELLEAAVCGFQRGSEYADAVRSLLAEPVFDIELLLAPPRLRTIAAILAVQEEKP